MEEMPAELYHNCPKCNCFISDECAHCPHCGEKQVLCAEGVSAPLSKTEPPQKRRTLIIVGIVVGLLLVLLAIGAYYFVQQRQEEPIIIQGDSLVVAVDSSLLYNDEYRQIDRSEKYTIDLTHWWDVALREEAGDSIGDYYQVEERPKNCEFTKSLDLEWPVRLKGVKYIEQLQSAILSRFSEKRSVTIDDFVVGYFKQTEPDNIEGIYNLYDKIKLERCDAPDQCVQFRIVHEAHAGNGFGSGSASYSLIDYIAYDKMTQKLLTLYNVFSSGSSAGVIAQINREITRMNEKEGEDYANVTTLPERFHIGRTGITFISTDSPRAIYHGNYLEIAISYNVLIPYLSDDFVKMLRK